MALFSWPAKSAKVPPEVGDTRRISVKLWWPRCVDGEWRWLGDEDIRQEYQRWFGYSEGFGWCNMVGWRDVSWGQQIREGKMRTNVKRHGSSGPAPCPRPPPPPNPPGKR